MSIRSLPQIAAPQRPKNFQWDAPSDVLTQWADQPLAAAGDDETTISIFDVIGEDWWSGGGFTAKRLSAALRSIGNRDIAVNINSPGGDMFEGIAMYNMLAEHQGRVTVNVLGLAASAASVIAMAGDTINMGTGSFLMIHNAWGVVIGNKADMRASADVFDGFDAALADIYEARTGVKRSEIVALMDGETFLSVDEAIRRGFADARISESGTPAAQAAGQVDPALLARRRTEAALAKAGFSRSDRQQMIAAMGGTPRDASTTIPAARDAGTLTGLRALIDTLK